MLTGEQSRAVGRIISDYNAGAVASSLSGIPGSGKTHTTGELVRRFALKDLRIAVVASTNKAVDVIRNKAAESGWYHFVAYWGTVHKLLGLIVTEDGLKRVRRHGPKEYDVVVVDEASMLPSDIVNLLKNESAFTIFVGDKNQLPPIEEERPVAFIVPGPHLRESQRTADQKLKDLVTYVTGCVETGKEVDPTYLEPFAVKDLMAWQDGIDKETMALAFTNEEVRRLNRVLRRGRQSEYDFGEQVVFTAPVYVQEAGKQRLAFATSEIGTVKAATQCRSQGYPAWNLRIKGQSEERYVLVPDTGLDNLNFAKYLREQGFPEPSWVKLAYAYALTVHRAQGSEWDKVAVNMGDFWRCQDEAQRTKLIYVAVSRARKHLSLYLGR
jgi:ATP-dependent exoDNAse (exonuclease V) alpha subunit